jgi:hypothetical protein
MTPQEIQERNEQIALMLGAIYSSNGEAWGFGNAKNIGSIMFDGVMYRDVIQAERFEKELKFHSDWNWLMEAVEFIQKELIKNNDEFCIEFYEGLPGESMTFVSYAEQNVKSKSSKEAVFIAVSDFAKLYNEKKL